MPFSCFSFRRLAACVLATVAVAFVPGCFSDQVAGTAFNGNDFVVTVWSGGKAVRVYRSIGGVEHLLNSDSWMFLDKEYGVVRVSGTVTIEGR